MLKFPIAGFDFPATKAGDDDSFPVCIKYLQGDNAGTVYVEIELRRPN